MSNTSHIIAHNANPPRGLFAIAFWLIHWGDIGLYTIAGTEVTLMHIKPTQTMFTSIADGPHDNLSGNITNINT